MSEHDVPRRTFLGVAAGAAASVGLMKSATILSATERGERSRSAIPPAPPMFKLGVASYSLREFPLEAALTMIKTLRTPYVNFKSVHVPYEKTPDELAAIRKSIEADGFQIVGGGTITFEKD